jgi:hypothetical protein
MKLPHLKPGNSLQTMADNMVALINAGFSRPEAKRIAEITAGFRPAPTPEGLPNPPRTGFANNGDLPK